MSDARVEAWTGRVFSCDDVYPLSQNREKNNVNVPLTVQNVEPPEEISPEEQAVQGGKPSELKVFDGHLPGRAHHREELIELDWYVVHTGEVSDSAVVRMYNKTS